MTASSVKCLTAGSFPQAPSPAGRVRTCTLCGRMLIRLAMETDTPSYHRPVREERAGEEVFWALFAMLTGLVLARVVDPVTALEILMIITGGA